MEAQLDAMEGPQQRTDAQLASRRVSSSLVVKRGGWGGEEGCRAWEDGIEDRRLRLLGWLCVACGGTSSCWCCGEVATAVGRIDEGRPPALLLKSKLLDIGACRLVEYEEEGLG